MKYYSVSEKLSDTHKYRYTKNPRGVACVDSWIKHEIYTKRELERLEKRGYLIPWKAFECIEISKQKTYFSFGARFIQHKYRSQFYK